MRHARGLCLGLLLWGHGALAGTVDAAQYDAFWVWAGVRPQAAVREARNLYVLQGQIEASPEDDVPVRFLAQGVAMPALHHADIWLVYRVHTLRWTPRIDSILLAQLGRWRAGGHTITGIQIDFDARTHHLEDYLAFLQRLRERLPADYRLSITGLMDWSSRIDVDQINRLRGMVDEVVIQTYQGRHTIRDYRAYLPRVSRLQLPYKIGLVQGGEWEAPSYLAGNPWFRGYVVFLQNR
ncbi:DUF3142 domain-containing protein [Cupriavidus necator]